MGNYMNERIKKKILELRERMGGRCTNPNCEHPFENLQFAHVKRTKLKGRGRGRKERYYDVFKHPDCYILLSKDCHKRFDNGELCFADFNTFQCPNWVMFWEAIYIEENCSVCDGQDVDCAIPVERCYWYENPELNSP